MLGYQAALAAAHAALVAAGYAAARGESHHVRIIESLRFTIGLDLQTVTFLGRMRRKRNEGLYLQVGVVSKTETEEILQLARRLRAEIEAWLRRHHPTLLPNR